MMLKKLLCVFCCAALLTGVCARAGEADDEEARAEKDKAKLDRKAADEKAKKDAAAGKSVKPDDKPNDKAERLADDPFEKFARERRDAEAGKPEAPVGGKPAAAGVNDRPAPAPDCPLCKGTGILPLLPYKPYIKFEGEAPPKPEYPAVWNYCDKCRAGIDPKAAAAEISADLKDRQDRARGKQKDFEDKVGKKLTHFETPFVSVHSTLAPPINQKVADALEKCAGLLQANSKSLVLLQTRADEDDLVFIGDDATYGAYIDKAMTNIDATNRELAKKTTGFHTNHVNSINMGKAAVQAENRAVFALGGLLMDTAANHKAKHWLTEGFASYCENATLGMNTTYTITYEANTVKFGKNWNDDLKKLVKDGKLKPWDEIFNISLEHLSALEYLHCFGMVSFLIKLDPQRFDKFILKIKEGEESGPAIEKVYGRKLKDIQLVWVQWIQTQK